MPIAWNHGGEMSREFLLKGFDLGRRASLGKKVYAGLEQK